VAAVASIAFVARVASTGSSVRSGGIFGSLRPLWRMSELRKSTYRTICALGERQGGFVERRQLLGAGISATTIKSWLATSRLTWAWHGVYCVGHMPTEPRDLAFGAMLATGEDSALAGFSAGAFYGAIHSWPETVELISPRQRRLHGVVVHRSSTLLLRDVWRFRGLRVTSPARTALDLAAHLDEKRLKATVDHLRLARPSRLTLEALVDVVVRNLRHPGARPLRALLGEASRAPTRSRLEREIWPAFAHAHHLPRWEPNETVAGIEVDVLVDGLVAVELDTIETHILNFSTDRRRDAHILAQTGIPVIRVLDTQIETEPRQVAANIIATVRRRRAETRRLAGASTSPHSRT
jgi:very-short-patch-repair endonuclease